MGGEGHGGSFRIRGEIGTRCASAQCKRSAVTALSKSTTPKQNPIRVLFVNTRSAIGSDVAVHLSLIENFDRSECEVTVATNSRAHDFAECAAILTRMDGVRVVPMNLGSGVWGLRGISKVIGGAASVLSLFVALIRLSILVVRHRIEVIHSTDRPRDALVATLLSKLTRRRCLLHLHIKWEGAAMGRATYWGVTHCDGILAISDFVRHSLVERGIPPEKVYTVLNATNIDRFDPSRVEKGALRARLGLGNGVPIIGVVGRIMVWKGQIDLVEALPIVRESFPGARLAIVGSEDRISGSEGSYSDRIKARAAELDVQDSVMFAGRFENSAEAFADMDVVCAPSTEEPFGLVVTEAMAMERPVVGYDSGALPEIIHSGENGLLVRAGDTHALGRAIVRLLSDPDLRAAMGRCARQRVQTAFDPRRQADEVAAVYASLCRRSPAPEPAMESGPGSSS